MTDRAEIERLLNQTGRTLEGLPNSYSMQEVDNRFKRIIGVWRFGDFVLHQSDVIELLVGALRDALDAQKTEISDAEFEEFSKNAREAMMRRNSWIP